MLVGAGLLGLGYGLFRLARGQRDWVATSALAAGVTMTAGAIGTGRRRPVMRTAQNMFGRVNFRLPRFAPQMMEMAPRMMTRAGAAMQKMLH